MGMGYGANWADVIQPEEIYKVSNCKILMANLLTALKMAGADGDEFASAMYSNGGDVKQAAGELTNSRNEQTKIVGAYQSLIGEFKKETGLDIHLDYHSSSADGDRYDEVDGAYWWVGGFRAISPAGVKAQKKWGIRIQQQSFVTFG